MTQNENEDGFEKSLSNHVQNPAGYYKVKLDYQGIKCHIMIKNIDEYEFEIRVKSNKPLNPKQIEGLKSYLEAEGYNNEARKHNMLW